MNGKKIKNLRQLFDLANNRKCVRSYFCKHIPAAFVMSMNARDVFLMIENGLFEYKKANKED